MDVVWNQPRMMNLLQSFHRISNVRSGFFDPDGKEIIAYPEPRSDFCKLIRADNRGETACRRCDLASYHYAVSHHGLYIYQCHAGLTEAIAPILGSGEERIGYLMIGQIQPPLGEDRARQWEEICGKVKPLHTDLSKLKAAYQKLPSIKMDQLRASANVLQALATYVWLDNYIRVQNEPLSAQVQKYIAEHIAEPLSLSLLMEHFKVGKTSLCKNIKSDLNLTVGELIRSVRIEEAKNLLHSSNKPVARIAEDVGIPDFNYFTKVFKEETGVTPTIYRRLCKGEYLQIVHS
ncbi:PocR ligand-binding domain-containing protein [Leadbettera azotonutricia]|uniref:Transcriptional regulator, AraC family n=1 Tax=Leadbettera azotonutricia (strain ATCC BAA-888 / DSM 13862 / ZAS-9) TaxID=545695 RepID=F5YCD9_LEAAZ|nr:PocR ligand-binding domain-containing protein [Leadbettera azotonutricia]AEF82585.1 transcriptional regulator, AraC family [Leadbettera azotonutricia ZAS-9]